MGRLFTLLFTVPIFLFPAYGQSGEVLAPCGPVATSAFAPGLTLPTIIILGARALRQKRWIPPACTGWLGTSNPSLVVGITGTLPDSVGPDDVLKRIATISTLKDVRYWSESDEQWRPIVTDASALSRLDARSRRVDFSVLEFTPNARLYYWENDSRLGEMIYQLTVLERSADRVVIASKNITPLKYSVFEAVPSGGIQ